jgi:GntR family transcriptional repressor for pyruvate dehydrogenase complex
VPSPAPRSEPPSRRPRVADDAFEHLAREILAGTFAPGSALPSERDLADRLGVSRVLVRQAIHRLADLGLLEVRQGASTRVGDPAQSPDLRMVELAYRLGTRLPARLQAFVIERQYMNGVSLLELASLRATDAGRADVLACVERESEGVRTAADVARLERAFWEAIAAAGGNAIFEAELRWWYRIVGDRMPRPRRVVETPVAARVAFHRELARCLVERRDPLALYLAVVRPLLASLDRSSKGIHAAR